MTKKSKQPPAAPVERRWLRNGELAKYLGVSNMTVWRMKRNRTLRFPRASTIGNIEFNDIHRVDAWMKARVTS